MCSGPDMRSKLEPPPPPNPRYHDKIMQLTACDDRAKSKSGAWAPRWGTVVTASHRGTACNSTTTSYRGTGLGTAVQPATGVQLVTAQPATGVPDL
jgi:hypothetical protein